jgi:molecular chaperone DnaK
VPKIEVTFRLDANGVVHIDAKDLGTGKSQRMKVIPTSGLSQDEVSRLVAEGDKFKYADEIRRELAELRNQAETLLYTTEQALEGYADLVDADTLGQTRAKAGELRQLLAEQSELSQLRIAYQELEAMTFAIAEKMYGGADEGTPPEAS